MEKDKNFLKKKICSSCLKSRCGLSSASLIVFWEISRILKDAKSIHRRLLIEAVRAAGPAKSWVKEVLEKAIKQGCLAEDGQGMVRLATRERRMP